MKLKTIRDLKLIYETCDSYQRVIIDEVLKLLFSKNMKEILDSTDNYEVKLE